MSDIKKKIFKGQVKISDVQAAFDDIIGRVNTLVDAYNDSIIAQDINYALGGSTLAPAGYTLTVGGLRQFCQACDGFVIGAKPFKISDTSLKMTTGSLVTKHGIYSLPDSVVNIPTSTSMRTLYFNIETGLYQWTGAGTVSETVEVQRGVASNLYNPDPLFPDLFKINCINNNISSTDTILASSGGASGDNITLSFYKIPEGANTAETVANGKVEISIGDYAHIPCSFLDGNATITEYAKDIVVGREGITLGTLEEIDGKMYFTPKLDIAHHAYYLNHVNYSQNIFLRGGAATGTVNESGAAEVSLPYMSNTKISSYPATWDNTFIYKFGVDSITNKRVIFVTLGNTDESIYKAQLELPQDISRYNINCILPRYFYMGRAVSDGRMSTIVSPNQDDYWNVSDYLVVNNNVEYRLNTGDGTYSEYEVVQSESDSAAYRICDINPLADSKLINTINGVLVEDINGTFKITSQSRWVKPVSGVDRASSGFRGETPDTSSKPLFVWGQEAQSNTDEGGYGTPKLYLLDKIVQWNRKAGHRRLDWWSPLNMLFVPKGVDNPYTYDKVYNNFTHWFNVNISKNIKDS